MIITGIRAENFLKYRTLDLGDLPRDGVITVAGANESGKSSIGEAICFALFGRTFSLNPDELQKLIRWGESACSIDLCFISGDDDHYRISRMLDRDGNHGVLLSRVGEEDAPVARGIREVDDAVYDLLGYGYDEFIESFYLAQRETIAPHPHSQAVKSLAGLTPLEYVAYEHEQEIEQEREAIGRLRGEIDELEAELKALALDPRVLGELESEQHALQANENLLQEKRESLGEGFVAYREMLPKRYAARKARRRARVLRFLSLLLAVFAALAWGALARMPEHAVSQSLLQWLEGNLPQWQGQYQAGLLYLVAGFGLLFILLWVRVVVKQTRLAGYEETGDGFADQFESARISALAPADGDVDQEGGSDESLGEVASRIRSEEIPFSELEPRVEQLIEQTERRGEALRQQLIRLRMAIEKEQERCRQAEQLQEIGRDLLQNIAGHEGRITLRERALELLNGALRELSQRFNRELGDSVRKTLPVFTDNNYEHLQIDDDLSVRVFSGQKRDFMDLDEVSSGTQRQIMLAIRLALSQALIQRTESGDQFVFLDEPFAFFDQERTRNALHSLPKLDPRISQIWIVAQDFPQGEAFDLSLSCSNRQQELLHPSS
ncbi:MAG: AAA family ATPase [Sedimenticola sp.]|nr:AAA family ATPase [Sedimenticola sp.]